MEEGRTARGVREHGDWDGCAGCRGSGRAARVERRLDALEGAVVGSRRGRDGRTPEGGRRSGDREGARRRGGAGREECREGARRGAERGGGAAWGREGAGRSGGERARGS